MIYAILAIGLLLLGSSYVGLCHFEEVYFLFHKRLPTQRQVVYARVLFGTVFAISMVCICYVLIFLSPEEVIAK